MGLCPAWGSPGAVPALTSLAMLEEAVHGWPAAALARPALTPQITVRGLHRSA